MNGPRDPDVLIKAYLAEGIDELPDRSYDAVRAVIDHTRQWAVVGPWHEPQIINATRFALVAAALVLAVILVIRFVPSTIIGPEPTSTPTPVNSTSPSASTTARPSASPTSLASAASQQSAPAGDSETPRPLPTSPYTLVVSPGRYVTTDTVTRLPVSFYLPMGWQDMKGIMVLGEQPDVFQNRAAFSTWIVDRVFDDACHWSGTARRVATASDLVNVLSHQSERVESAPQNVTLGGVPATLIVLSVDPSFDESGCDGGILRNWPDAVGATRDGWQSLTGQVDSVYVIDSSAGPLVVTASVFSNASQADKDALAAMVDSLQIGSD